MGDPVSKSWFQTLKGKWSRIVKPVGGTGQSNKNRSLATVKAAYAASTNDCNWSSADNVTEFYITCYYPTAYAATTDATQTKKDRVLMLFDGLNEASNAASFADLGGASINVDYSSLVYGVKYGPFIAASGYFQSLAFKPSVDNTIIDIEAQ